ncbi:hypothetical protein GCM10010954_32590 [Halobacillus andaensis]|uniref:Uncharacterized protein n=2 Tax=Halobacillus andaensis TaxID=1176239 RepID=A0A917EY11_HALAA|nr:hypothetical protein GCM10010954_32590 [Halobacillus andaensis]
MFYLMFALFFTVYLLAGYFTPLEFSSTGAALSVALILANLYMFFKSRKTAKDKQESHRS